MKPLDGRKPPDWRDLPDDPSANDTAREILRAIDEDNADDDTPLGEWRRRLFQEGLIHCLSLCVFEEGKLVGQRLLQADIMRRNCSSEAGLLSVMKLPEIAPHVQNCGGDGTSRTAVMAAFDHERGRAWQSGFIEGQLAIEARRAVWRVRLVIAAWAVGVAVLALAVASWGLLG